MQIDAFCILSDSGTITEEADLLNLPAINIRNAHERPEGMDAGTLIMSGLKKQEILSCVEIITSQVNKESYIYNNIEDYKPQSVSNQILRVVLSYVSYINRTIWSK